MRAIVVDEFGPPEALQARETATPVPGPGEVLVETYAAPINYVDMLVVGGTYQFLPQRPFIPGKGPAGVVAALGYGTAGIAVGDEVFGLTDQFRDGAAAEYVAVEARNLAPKPQTARVQGYSLRSWKQAGLNLVAVSDIDPQELANLEQGFEKPVAASGEPAGNP